VLDAVEARRVLAQRGVTPAAHILEHVGHSGTDLVRAVPRRAQGAEHLVDVVKGEPSHRVLRSPDYAVYPPSTSHESPVTKLASSLATKATTAATSAGRPTLPTGYPPACTAA